MNKKTIVLVLMSLFALNACNEEKPKTTPNDENNASTHPNLISNRSSAIAAAITTAAITTKTTATTTGAQRTRPTPSLHLAQSPIQRPIHVLTA